MHAEMGNNAKLSMRGGLGSKFFIFRSDWVLRLRPWGSENILALNQIFWLQAFPVTPNPPLTKSHQKLSDKMVKNKKR